MAGTSSANCLSCMIPYQCRHSLNAWTPFSERRFSSLISAPSHPLPQAPFRFVSWLFTYHAVGNDYLNYSWGYFMQKKCITYSCILENLNSLGSFLMFVGQDQLGENYQTHSHVWGSKNTLGKKICITYWGYSGPSEKNHVYENFRPHDISSHSSTGSHKLSSKSCRDYCARSCMPFVCANSI